MTYPKQIMSITDLAKMGFSAKWLRQLVHSNAGKAFTVRTSPNGKFLIDTEEFQNFLKRNVEESK